jgi:chaperonin cofactor prefoldin
MVFFLLFLLVYILLFCSVYCASSLFTSLETQKLFVQKQQVLSQFNENTLVKGVSLFSKQSLNLVILIFHLLQELDLLEAEAKVYKLVGPLLMTVELDESKQNVEKRLQLIESELKKIDSSIAAKQKEQEALGDEIAKLQQQLQADAALAAKQAAGLV